MKINRRDFLKYVGSFTVLSSTTPITGCLGTKKQKKETLTVKDAANREVEIPKTINKIVAVGPGALRLITYLNCIDKVVGVEEIEKNRKEGRLYYYANPEISEFPSIGQMHGGNAELIASQDPDVIFKTMSTASDCDSLESKTGVPVISLGYGDLSSSRTKLFNNILLIGNLLDKEKRANEVIQYIKSTINNLKNRTNDITELKEAYIGGVNYKASYGFSGTEPKYAPFEFVNAKNVASGVGTEHATVSKEKIIEWGPEFVFVDEGGYKLVMNDLSQEEFNSLEAVKKENVYGVLPQSYYHHMHGAVLANSFYIGKVLYPNKFDDIVPKKKANEIFEKLVGEPVYEEIKNDFGGFKKIKKPY